MNPLARLGRQGGAWLWAGAITVSAVLLAAVLATADWPEAGRLIAQGRWPLLAGAVLVMSSEGLFTAWRLGVLAPGTPGVADCLRVAGWWVVLLVLLPARLGEAGGVFLLRRFLGHGAGAAIGSLLVQRLLDVAVLGAVFAVCLLALLSPAAGGALLPGAVAVVALLALVLGRMRALLRGACRGLIALGARRRGRWVRGLLRMLLEARGWHRRHVTPRAALRIALLTLGKWACNLGGFVLLLAALGLPFTPSEGLLLGAAYNFLAVIPLQTVGGIGLAEAGLAGLFALFGFPVSRAASASIVLRAVLITVPFLFWAGATGAARALSRDRARARPYAGA